MKPDETSPKARCGCGREIRYAFHALACLECGAACCPACSVGLESVTYCRRCAGSLLDAPTVTSEEPFDLR
jgi:hypothetical protein